MLELVSSSNHEYRRSGIRRLAVRRYRSLENVLLDNLPPLIVLYGPNGSGKSNLLRAVQLALRAAVFAVGRSGPRQIFLFSLQDADRELDLRPEDFRFGDVPEIRVGLVVDVGTRFLHLASSSKDATFQELEIEVVFQLDGTRGIRFWVEQLTIDAQNPEKESLYTIERMLPRLVQTSNAYRIPGAKDDPQAALYSAFLSEDPNERDAAQRFGRRLARAGLFGTKNDDISLIPVDSRTYGEKQIRFRHPTHGELSLRNLGSGEQQLVLMLAQRVITPFPITHLEEPEAHLHVTLMEKLAPILLESVLGDGSTPDVDQLWMATHHHMFAIAEEFFDVSLDDQGATNIVRRKRDEAVRHFYEPSPYWDTLRGLVESGLSAETVVSLDDQGNPVTARQVLDSIHGDRKLANQFVKAATEAFVLSLAKDGSAS